MNPRIRRGWLTGLLLATLALTVSCDDGSESGILSVTFRESEFIPHCLPGIAPGRIGPELGPIEGSGVSGRAAQLGMIDPKEAVAVDMVPELCRGDQRKWNWASASDLRGTQREDEIIAELMTWEEQPSDEPSEDSGPSESATPVVAPSS